MQNMKVKVNGKRVSLPFIKLGAGISILKDGYRVILRTNDGRTSKEHLLHMSLVKNSFKASWTMALDSKHVSIELRICPPRR